MCQHCQPSDFKKITQNASEGLCRTTSSVHMAQHDHLPCRFSMQGISEAGGALHAAVNKFCQSKGHGQLLQQGNHNFDASFFSSWTALEAIVRSQQRRSLLHSGEMFDHLDLAHGYLLLQTATLTNASLARRPQTSKLAASLISFLTMVVSMLELPY